MASKVGTRVARAGCLAGFLLLAIGLLWGCDEETDSPPVESDPAAVARAFLTAFSRGDPVACEHLSADAISGLETVTGEIGCEAAVEEHRDVLSVGDYVVRRRHLMAALERGELTEGGRFTIELPSDASVSLHLRDSGSGWQVDSTPIVGQTIECAVGDEIGEGPGC